MMFRFRTKANLLLLVLMVLGTGSVSHAQPSGDALIDAWMNLWYEQYTGGSGGQIVRSNQVTCGGTSPPSNESNCPNDATYSPAQDTGGYQAWAAGVKYSYQTTYDQQCGIETIWHYSYPDDDWSFTIQPVCELVINNVPQSLTGAVYITLEWGEEASGLGGDSGATSTLAFRPNNFIACSPLWLFGPDAKCSNNFNSSYVDEPGYEAKVIIDDPACSLGAALRSHTVLDKNAGCMYYYDSPQFNELPANYQDTTAFDSPDTLTVSFGSADASSIIPGDTYILRQTFRSNSAPNMEPWRATHVGAITTEVDNPACILSLYDPAVCFFNVDIASVGGLPRSFQANPSPPIIPPF